MIAGEKLGPYEIVSLLGKGGMGEVYRAHDARVGREVAVKVSSERFGERFEREARAIASLNHPNICTLYDVGPNYLVMELVEGEPPQGPLPLDEALRIARQIASALQEAHAKNIIHRDLKPGNIRVKADGAVKVLDFGLAKINAGPSPSSHDSPTLSMAATQAGMILGTAAYMSPEQARGREADKRSDIWAFGVVLYELLTGQQLFEGETISDVLAGVLRHEPDWSPVPEKARRLLKRCLEKDPKRRLQDIGDMDLLLEQSATDVPKPTATGFMRWIWPAAAAVFAIVAAVVSFVHYREQPPKAEVTRFEISAPDKTSFSSSFALSPDGRTLAFTAAGSDGLSRIWLKPMDKLEARPLNGTEGAQNPVIWSPDSRALAFSGGTVGALKRIDVAGGPAQTLCPVVAGAPIGAWSPSGVIIFRDGAGLSQVPERGGVCSLLTALDSQRGEIRHTSPFFLPDGRHFLYLRVAKLEDTGVYIGSLDSKPAAQGSQRLLAGNSPAAYASLPGASTGYLLFLREGTLMAQPFNPGSLTLTGDARPVSAGVGVAVAGGGDVPLFSVSSTGTLVYRSSGGTQNLQLTWYDRKGQTLGVVGDPGTYSAISLSPDGKRLAVDLPDASANRDLWIYDLVSGTKNRFTFDLAADYDPVWSFDNSRIFFTSNRGGGSNLYQKASDLAGNEQPLLKSEDRKFPQDVSPDGRFLMYVSASATGAQDLWFMPLQGVAANEGKPRPFLTTQFAEGAARFSPDGRFVVYVSNETGKPEVYVRPFSPDGTPGGPQMVSQGGGSQPLWRGNEIFYIAPDSKVMAVKVTTGTIFQRGQPVPLFTVPVFGGGGFLNTNTRWDVTPDGKKFIVNTVRAESSSIPMTAVLNWAESLK